MNNNNVSDTVGEGERNGIRTSAIEGNLILKNTCVGNGTNYELDSDDTAGPIVSASGFLSGTDPLGELLKSYTPRPGPVAAALL